MNDDNKTPTTLQTKTADLKEYKLVLLDSDGESQADSLFLLKDNYQDMELKYITSKNTLLYNIRNKRSINKKSRPEDSGPP